MNLITDPKTIESLKTHLEEDIVRLQYEIEERFIHIKAHRELIRSLNNKKSYLNPVNSDTYELRKTWWKNQVGTGYPYKKLKNER